MSQGQPEDVDSIGRDIDALERLIGSISPADDFGEAMVRNQNLMLRTMRAAQTGNIDRENLPVGLVGTATRRIGGASDGPAIFTVGGSEFRVQVTAETEVQDDQEVVVIDDGNVVVPADAVEVSASGTRLRDTGTTTASTAAPGQSNAAALALGPLRTNFDVAYAVTAAATLTIEHSPDGDEWFPLYETDVTDSDTIQGSSAFENVRAYLGDGIDRGNVENVVISAKGV